MSHRETILVIASDPWTRETVGQALTAEGYGLAEATTGAQAVEAALTRRPDLLILEPELPDREGIDFIRDFRAWSPTLILVLSGRTQEATKIETLDAGADDYLDKPCGLGELLARVRALLRRRPAAGQPSEAVIRFGEWRIDLATQVVSRQGTPLHLTPIEYRLLVHLAANPHRVLPHHQLLSHIWGEKAADKHQYLRVYMGQLRQKIEANPAEPHHLLTEVGVGYRFQP